MGFIQFPGTEAEPARSGPGVAQQLQHIYTEYLSHFDRAYVQSVLQKKGLFSSQPGNNTAGGPQGNNPATGSPQVHNITASMQGSNGAPGNSIPGAIPPGMVRLHRPVLELC
jgi:hypothetical protein